MVGERTGYSIGREVVVDEGEDVGFHGEVVVNYFSRLVGDDFEGGEVFVIDGGSGRGEGVGC